MSDYDAIVVGAGHNGLTAAALLQRGGVRTLCLEKNRYSGGMAATVEIFPGYRFEIAGSVLFPLADEIRSDLGFNECPTINTDVMSVNIGRPDDEPMIFYRDPVQLMMHLDEKYGPGAVTGMAELLAWSEGPARAIGRFEVREPPKTLDEMYACARTESERTAINEMLFGSAMDVLGRFFPDPEKHRILRGMLSFLAVNSTYRGPYTPGSAACLAFALAAPPGVEMMSKIEGGIGSLADHVKALFEAHGGELRLRTPVKKILTEGDRVTGVQLEDGDVISAPIVISNLDPGVTFTHLIDSSILSPELVERVSTVDHRAAYIQMHFALDGLPEYAPPYEFLNEPGMQHSLGIFGSAEEMQRDWEDCRRGIVPADPAMGFQVPSLHDRSLAPEGKHAASAFAFYFPVEVDQSQHGRLKDEMAKKVIEKMTRLAPNFKDIVIRHTTFASFHMGTMFGCPGGDFCHGLLHPGQMGCFRPGPRGWPDLPVPLRGLYLAGAGCYGGPGITFIPGYNAGYQALEDASELVATHA
jgi:phytoene dehydrogenase-like protein